MPSPLFERRSAQPDSTAHRDVAEAVSAAGGRSALETMYDNFMTLLQSRDCARRVEVTVGDIDGTVDRVDSVINTER